MSSLHQCGDNDVRVSNTQHVQHVVTTNYRVKTFAVWSVPLAVIYLSASTLSFLKAVCSVSSSLSFPPASMVGGGRSDQPPS